MFKITLSGQMFDSLSVWEHLSAAADYRYDGIELRSTHINPSSSQEKKDAVKAYLRRRGLPVSCLSCFVGDFGLLDDQECAETLETFKKWLDIAVEFEAPMVRMWPAWVESAAAEQAVYDRAALWMQKCADLAQQRGLRIAMEMHHGTILDTAESSLKLLKLIDRPNVGLIVDPVNLYQVPVEDIPGCIRQLKGYIFDVHIKDIIRLASPAHRGCFRYDFYAEHIGRFTRVVPPAKPRNDYYAHRRIGMGGVDWPAIIDALEEIGYDGCLAVESVSEKDAYMPAGRELAAACMRDVKSLLKKQPSLPHWHTVSPEEPGLHEVVAPGRTPNKAAHILRLNLRPGEETCLRSGDLEMNPVLIEGGSHVSGCGIDEELVRFDSFYIPGNCEVMIKAGGEGAVFYIGAGKCEGIGKPFFRRFDKTAPIGKIHQIHGEGSGQREVFFTLDEDVPASRLICGLTWGADGMWTSWPPHQHEIQLEEVYCYFDMPEPHAGFHVSYGTDGTFNDPRINVVSSGHMVLAADGYHPTVAVPGTCNAYLWVLVAHSPETRGYNYAKTDPRFS